MAELREATTKPCPPTPAAPPAASCSAYRAVALHTTALLGRPREGRVRRRVVCLAHSVARPRCYRCSQLPCLRAGRRHDPPASGVYREPPGPSTSGALPHRFKRLRPFMDSAAEQLLKPA